MPAISLILPVMANSARQIPPEWGGRKLIIWGYKGQSFNRDIPGNRTSQIKRQVSCFQ
jgi:hypothetical protein